MKVYLNSIVGIDDAIETMFLSKRTWTPELREEIRKTCDNVLDRNGNIKAVASKEELDTVMKWLTQVCKMTRRHITVGRFIDFSFTVEGLHRGGQDDWDAHTKRYENRIIRSSTRLADFGNEKSDYYKDKIITTDEALNILEITAPNEITLNGKKYVKTINGYILEEYKDNRDVKRGLYMLSIPSNFLFKVNLTELAHVYKERNINGTANPEVKDLAEICIDKIQAVFYQFNRELMLAIQN